MKQNGQKTFPTPLTDFRNWISDHVLLVFFSLLSLVQKWWKQLEELVSSACCLLDSSWGHGGRCMYVVREVYCYNRTEEQNFLLQVMMCMQWYELDCPFFTLFDKIFYSAFHSQMLSNPGAHFVHCGGILLNLLELLFSTS